MYSNANLKAQKAPDYITNKDLLEANNVVARMVLHVLYLMDIRPNSQIKSCPPEWQPKCKDEWEWLLLLNIFDGSAMSYKASESHFVTESDEKYSTIEGQPCRRHFTGSLFEGIGCASRTQYSDTDFMNVLSNYKATASTGKDIPKISPGIENEKSDFNNTGEIVNYSDTLQTREVQKLPTQHPITQKPCKNPEPIKRSDLKIVRIYSGSHPGYVSLSKSSESLELLKLTESLNHGPVIQSTREEYLLAHEFDFDNAIAVECENWPDDALSWESRSRPSGWPGPDLISKCKGFPCHIVSKSHASNPDDRFEWRYSFAKHEGVLMRTLPIETKMVYIISKILLKQMVLKADILTTYHLKTLFLWYCENRTTVEFARDNVEINVKQFLHFIIDHVKKHNFPNYFISTNNMISHMSKSNMDIILDQITNIASDFIKAACSVETGKIYPFSIKGIAKELKTEPSETDCIRLKFQSNFMFAIIDHVFGFHLPNSHVMWMYCQNIPQLMAGFQDERFNYDLLEILETIRAVQQISSIAYEIYDITFVKLVLLFWSLVETKMSHLSQISQTLLSCSLQQSDSSLSTCMYITDVIITVCINLGMFAVESCCHGLRQWVLKEECENTLFMLTLKKTLSSISLSKSEHECGHLLTCLLALTNIFEISNTSIEVGIATSLRLSSSRDTVETVSTLCEILKGSDMNGVLKQLLYAVILSLENDGNGDESTVEGCGKTNVVNKQTQEIQNSTRALDAIREIVKSPFMQSGMDTFRFVSASIVFQKLTMNPENLHVIKKYLHVLKLSELSKQFDDVRELEKDIEELLQGGEVGSAFPFIVYYTWKSLVSAGLPFTLSVMDELFQPHYNLGVLSAAGIELMAIDAIDVNIATIETWINRSTIAPVQQNVLLKIKMYGRLGHLYHIKSISETIESKKKIMLNKALLMFRTAMKENEKDLSVIIDYLLLLWNRKTCEFETYLNLACNDDDIQQITNYLRNSEALLCKMEEIQVEVRSKGHLKVSSLVFAQYIAILYHESNTRDNKRSTITMEQLIGYLDKMVEIVNTLREFYDQIQGSVSDCSDQREVIIDSSLLVGFAAKRLSKIDVERMIFQNVLKLDPTHKTAVKRLELIASNMKFENQE